MDLISREPEIEERKGKSAQNVPKEDLISRKAAIDAVNGVIADYIPTLYGRYEALPLEMAMAIKRLPTAQPEKRTEERTETHACDCISRQAAIEALDALCDRECEYSKKQRSVMCGACHLGSAFDVVEQLPSAQPETCDTCKHGYFGDTQCDNCCVRYPSHYERRTDG